MIYLKLFVAFLEVGLFSFGGGYVSIPLIREIVLSYGWMDDEMITHMIAVSESTPGPLMVNMATYVGYINGMQEGSALHATLGAATATLGLITPSIIIILIVAIFLRSFRDNKYVNNAFYGLRPASMGLVAAAGLSVVINNLFEPKILEQGFNLSAINWIGWGLAIVLWIFTNKVKKTKGLHPIIFILASAVAGIIFQMG